MALAFEILPSVALTPAVRDQLCALCTDAYDEEFAEIFVQLGPGVHVLGRSDGALVAHAMWVTRWLQPQGREPLRTAYVEAVATHPAQQRRGFATAIMARVAQEIRSFDLGALSPSDEALYARWGWQTWKGPLFIRTADQLEATPEETVMVLRLPQTPADLDLNAPMSAEWRRGELW